MAKPTRGKGGKFTGSIGEGVTAPTAADLPQIGKLGPAALDPEAKYEKIMAQAYNAYTEYQQAVAQKEANERFTAVFDDPNNQLVRSDQAPSNRTNDAVVDPRNTIWYPPGVQGRLPVGTPYIHWAPSPGDDDYIDPEDEGEWVCRLHGIDANSPASVAGFASISDTEGQKALANLLHTPTEELLTEAALVDSEAVQKAVRADVTRRDCNDLSRRWDKSLNAPPITKTIDSLRARLGSEESENRTNGTLTWVQVTTQDYRDRKVPTPFIAAEATTPETQARLHAALRAEGLTQVVSPRLHRPANTTLWARTANPLSDSDAGPGAYHAVNDWITNLTDRHRGPYNGRV